MSPTKARFARPIVLASWPSRFIPALLACSMTLASGGALASAQQDDPKPEKPVKLSAKESTRLDNVLRACLLETSIVKTILKSPDLAALVDVMLTMEEGAKLGKKFTLPNKTSIDFTIKPGPKGTITIAKLATRMKLTLHLAEPMEIEGVKLAEDTPLERTTNGAWWVQSKEVQESMLAREKAKREAEALKKKQLAKAPEDEEAAAKKLKNVKELIGLGNVDLARIRLQAIIEVHSRTKSAEEARKMLEKLKKM